MKRGIVGAAAFAAGILGADISVTSYVFGSTVLAALAQDSSSSSPGLANPGAAPGGFGNGGAGFGGGSTVAPTSGGAGAGTDAAAEGAAQKPGSEKPDHAEADKDKQAKPADGEGNEADTAKKPLEAEPEAAAMAATSTTPTPTEAVESSAKASVPNVSGTGNLTSSIPIDVPGFRGLEPSLALTYDSSRKTRIGATYQGWLGYAWGLDGFDVIERASVGYGIPAFDASDVFLFNGMELVPCAAGVVSPSCSTGGTHATENESYRRIAFNGATNEWKVTDRDGTVSTFRSVAAVSNASPAAGTPAYDLGQNYRWLLTAVTDTNNNSVAYSYSCSDSPVCYPETVSYNGNEIRFHREVRPDYILMANGHDISQTTQRIKTISIKVGGVLRDAYQLSYNQAPMSNTSRLARVDRYGRNATVAADGTISGGTQKLVQVMNYQDLAAGYVNKTGLFPPTSHVPYSPPNMLKRPSQVGDLDSDGKSELYGLTTYNTGSVKNDTLMVHLHISSNVFTETGEIKSKSSTEISTSPNGEGNYVFNGHFLASKKTNDIPWMRAFKRETSSGNTVYSFTKGIVVTSPTLALSAGSCGLAEYISICNVMPGGGGITYTSPMNPNSPPYVADMDGDSIDELLYGGGENLVGVADLNGSGRQHAIFSASDGKIRKATRNGGNWVIHEVISGVTCGGRKTSAHSSIYCLLGDINGDGATDLIPH